MNSDQNSFPGKKKFSGPPRGGRPGGFGGKKPFRSGPGGFGGKPPFRSGPGGPPRRDDRPGGFGGKKPFRSGPGGFGGKPPFRRDDRPGGFGGKPPFRSGPGGPPRRDDRPGGFAGKKPFRSGPGGFGGKPPFRRDDRPGGFGGKPPFRSGPGGPPRRDARPGGFGGKPPFRRDDRPQGSWGKKPYQRDENPRGNWAPKTFQAEAGAPDAGQQPPQEAWEKKIFPPAGAPSPVPSEVVEADDFIYGRHPVLELLRAEKSRVNKIWFLKGAQGPGFEELLRLAESRRIVFQWVERDRLDEMVRAANHQGVVARVSSVAYGDLTDLLTGGTPSPLVLLDGIEDPQNVGAILRNAAFFGAKAVVVPRWRSAGLSGTVMKASAGALAKVPLVQVTNIAQTLLELKEKGYWIYGADGEGTPLPSVTWNEPIALVIGAEGEGLHRLVKERCDVVAAIPGSGAMESLNASCAAAILMHEVFRRAQGRA